MRKARNRLWWNAKSVKQIGCLLGLCLLVFGSSVAWAQEAGDAELALGAALQSYAAANLLSPDDPRCCKYEALQEVQAAFKQVADAFYDTEAGLTARMMEGHVACSTPGDFVEDTAPLEEVTASAPGSWQAAYAHIHLGRVHHNRGVGEAEAEHPDLEAARYHLETSLMHAERAAEDPDLITDEAWRPLHELGGMHPREGVPQLVHFTLGVSLLGLGELDRGIAELLYVIDEFPEGEAAMAAEGRLNDIGLTAARLPESGSTADLVSIRDHPAVRDFTIAWAPSQRQVVLTGDRLRIAVSAGSDIIDINGTKARLTAPAQLQHGRMMVPEAFLNAGLRGVSLPLERYVAEAQRQSSSQEKSGGSSAVEGSAAGS